MICSVNQHTGFYMIRVSFMKELKVWERFRFFINIKTQKIYNIYYYMTHYAAVTDAYNLKANSLKSAKLVLFTMLFTMYPTKLIDRFKKMPFDRTAKGFLRLSYSFTQSYGFHSTSLIFILLVVKCFQNISSLTIYRRPCRSFLTSFFRFF